MAFMALVYGFYVMTFVIDGANVFQKTIADKFIIISVIEN